MNTYFFFFGSTPALSYAEVLKVFSFENYHYQIVSVSNIGLEVDLDVELDPLFIKKTGGIVKISKIKKAFNLEADFLAEVLKEKVKEGKISLGFSLYQIKNQEKIAEELKKKFYRLGLEIKNKLKGNGRSVRLVESKINELSSVIVKKEHLLDKGIDFTVIFSGLDWKIGETIAVQDFVDYGDLDFCRPAVDPKSGMTPPKLAKMLLNLGDKDNYFGTFLDPFCGSGTILLLAMLSQKFNKYLASDLSEKATADTNINVPWLIQKYKLAKDLISKVEVKTLDVLKLNTWIPENSIDFIVSELYLGPALRQKINIAALSQIRRELTTLFDKALKQMSRVMKSGATAICIFPCWTREDISKNDSFQNKIDFLSWEQSAMSAGLKIEPLLKDNFNLPMFFKERGSIIYGTTGQRVYREIVKFKKI